jgi:hypothetical protein
MKLEAIDHVVLPVGQLHASSVPLQKLGLKTIVPPPYLCGEPSSRCLFVGGSHNLFHLEIASPAPRHPLGKCIQRAVEEKRGLCVVALRVKGLSEVVDELKGKGINADIVPLSQDEGEPPCAVARLAVEDVCGVPLVLVEYPSSSEDQRSEVETEDGLNHALAVKRLDHLAAVASNLESQTHFWAHFLGVPLFGEVVTPMMIIRQFKIGDAIIELLGPNSPDSPIHKRTPGLISMMSLEVADLAASVAQARAAGFSIPDPATGVLPGTITATIPATETGGVALQLLQYKR